MLYKCTFHPDLPNLAFTGVYRGPYFGVIELQARWAAQVLSGNLSLPSKEVLLKGLEEEIDIKHQSPRQQFPRDYTEFANSIAKELQCLPDFEEIQRDDPDL